MWGGEEDDRWSRRWLLLLPALLNRNGLRFWWPRLRIVNRRQGSLGESIWVSLNAVPCIDAPCRIRTSESIPKSSAAPTRDLHRCRYGPPRYFDNFFSPL